MTHEQLQKRLLRFLWLYEGCVIAACLIGGGMIALGQGGSAFAAAPLFLVAVAEMLRIPVAGLATRIGFTGRVLSGVVLLAIAVISFEALSLIFEQFLDNRTMGVMQAQRSYDLATNALAQKEAVLSRSTAAVELAKANVTSLDADIANKERSAPTQPGFSGKTCSGAGGRTVTCTSDRQARADYSAAQKAHIATLEDLRRQRKIAQEKLEQTAQSLNGVSATTEREQVANARQTLTDTKSLSPMHKLAASVLGVKIADLSEEQFEAVKRWGILGLSGAFATLSAAISIVAHQPERNQKDNPLTRSLRAWLARRRKRVVRVVEKPVPSGERVIFKYIPVGGDDEKRRLGNYELRGETIRAYKEMI